MSHHTTAPDTDQLLSIADDLIRRAKALGADQAEASVTQSRSQEIAIRDGQLEAVEGSESKDAGLRVFFGKKHAGVSFSDLSEDGRSMAVERAVAMAKAASEDKFSGLVDERFLASTKPELKLYEAPRWTNEDLTRIANEVEQAARSVEGVSMTETAFASTGEAASASLSTNGVSHTSRRSNCGFGVSVIAANENGMERDYSMTSARRLADLRPIEEIGQEAGKRATARMGATQLASGNYPVLFDRRVAARFLGSLEGAISGGAIARGVSFLRDSLNQQVFGEHINIIDDPHRDWGMGSRPVDGEGVANERRHIIQDGVLTTWLLNSPSARQLELEPNGFATRSLGGAPGISTTNFYLRAGTQTPQQMMRNIDEGVLITEMFSPSLNPNTGDWSVGCSGFAIEKGEQAYPVNEITVAGNLKDIFMRLQPANDLKFWSSTNSPTLLVDNLSVGGA